MATVTVCGGEITVDAAGAMQCSTGWEVAQYTAVQPFDPATLDPLLIAGAVTAGFFMLLPVWAAASGVRHILKTISWR